MRSVTPDSNIYISALLWDGKPERLLEMGLAGEVRLFISDAIMEETLGVLEEKFQLSPSKLQRAKEYITRCTVRCVPKIKLDVVKADPEDNKIIECAVHSRSEAIITNDGDLLRMKQYDGIRMLKVHEFLRRDLSGVDDLSTMGAEDTPMDNLGTDEKRVAVEAIATLCYVKRYMVDLLLKPAGVPEDVYGSLLYKRDETGRNRFKARHCTINPRYLSGAAWNATSRASHRGNRCIVDQFSSGGR